MTYSTSFDVGIKGFLSDKLNDLYEKAYAKNAYVQSRFHDLDYYNGYQQAIKDTKECLDTIVVEVED